MTTKPNTQAIREKLDKELGSYKIDGKEFREMWGLFDLVVVFLDEQLTKKEEEKFVGGVIQRLGLLLFLTGMAGSILGASSVVVMFLTGTGGTLFVFFTD